MCTTTGRQRRYDKHSSQTPSATLTLAPENKPLPAAGTAPQPPGDAQPQ